MTEYDYSPEAYERYLATQTRIANWVDKTEQHRPQFQPAVPSVRPSMHPRYPSYDPQSRPKQQQPRQLFIHPPTPESESSDGYGDGPGPMPLPSSGIMFPPQQPTFFHPAQPMGHPMISPTPMVMPQTYMMPPHMSSRPNHRPHSSRPHSRSHSLHTPAYYSMAPPLIPPGYQYHYPPVMSSQPGYFIMQHHRGNQVPIMYR